MSRLLATVARNAPRGGRSWVLVAVLAGWFAAPFAGRHYDWAANLYRGLASGGATWQARFAEQRKLASFATAAAEITRAEPRRVLFAFGDERSLSGSAAFGLSLKYFLYPQRRFTFATDPAESIGRIVVYRAEGGPTRTSRFCEPLATDASSCRVTAMRADGETYTAEARGDGPDLLIELAWSPGRQTPPELVLLCLYLDPAAPLTPMATGTTSAEGVDWSLNVRLDQHEPDGPGDEGRARFRIPGGAAEIGRYPFMRLRVIAVGSDARAAVSEPLAFR